jgi:hypothetical protein
VLFSLNELDHGKRMNHDFDMHAIDGSAIAVRMVIPVPTYFRRAKCKKEVIPSVVDIMANSRPTFR